MNRSEMIGISEIVVGSLITFVGIAAETMFDVKGAALAVIPGIAAIGDGAMRWGNGFHTKLLTEGHQEALSNVAEDELNGNSGYKASLRRYALSSYEARLAPDSGTSRR